MNTSIHHSKEICKRLSENNLLESVKTVSEPYVVSIMKSMFQAGYHGKTVDMEKCSDRHRTSISRFLRNESIIDDWAFVAVYTDEGISATSTAHRDGFNRMITDALDGKIDLIVTKSVSRFARNTVDSLITVRKLKDKGVEIYFEKEGIYTLDSKGDAFTTD